MRLTLTCLLSNSVVPKLVLFSWVPIRGLMLPPMRWRMRWSITYSGDVSGDFQGSGGDMILLWGLSADTPLAAVRDALEQQGHPIAFIDQRTVLDTEVELGVGLSVEGRVRTRTQVIDLSTVTAAYLRFYSSQQLPVVERAG